MIMFSATHTVQAVIGEVCRFIVFLYQSRRLSCINSIKNPKDASDTSANHDSVLYRTPSQMWNVKMSVSCYVCFVQMENVNYVLKKVAKGSARGCRRGGWEGVWRSVGGRVTYFCKNTWFRLTVCGCEVSEWVIDRQREEAQNTNCCCDDKTALKNSLRGVHINTYFCSHFQLFQWMWGSEWLR